MTAELIERAEDLAARCIPPAAGIIREMIAVIEDKQRIRTLSDLTEVPKQGFGQHSETS